MFTLTYTSVREALTLLQATWLATAAASGDQIRGLTTYLRGLQQPDSLQYPLDGDGLAGAVVNRAALASLVESGFPPVHLPSVIRWGQTPHSKRNKQGALYLTIPLRHGTSGTQAGSSQMARRVYAVAKTLQPGQHLTAGPTHGGAIHAPGLQPYSPANPLNRRPGYQHAALQEGMRRVPHGRGSQYYTFRTMRQDASGWNLPATPGTQLAATVAAQLTPQITRMVEAAFVKDVESLFRQLET